MLSFLGRDKSFIVFLSTFPPRECGIATFTKDLTDAFDNLYAPREESRIVALNLDDYAYHTYSQKVIFQFPQTKHKSYRAIAKKLNMNQNVKLVNIQHEFGIFGGEYGSYILDFLDEIKKPVCITFHTVLPNPTEQVRCIVAEIASKSLFVIVMTEISREIITRRYGVPADKVCVINHGIHPIPYCESGKMKHQIGLHNRFILSSFGLIGKGKGIEYAIEALPEVVKQYPEVLYLIIGVTHPAILKQEGETYRNSLIKRIHELGLENNVIFYNQYLKTNELLNFLQASDIYLSLSQNPNQAVSGTLSYALGAGRPVISTSFMHAKEIVTPEVGILIGFNNSTELTGAILDLMTDKEKCKQMGEAAYFRTRKMIWPNIALSYMREIASFVPEFKEKESNLPPIKIKHIAHLTDEFGIFQFSERSTRNPLYGYTTDDNARALVAMVKFFKKNQKSKVSHLISVYLNFLENVSKSPLGFFNYVNYDKSFHTERNAKENLSDANARAYYALAFTASREYLPEKFRNQAMILFRRKFDIEKKIFSPRAVAFTILAISEWLTVEHNDLYFRKLKELADYLLDLFTNSKGETWSWFEDILSYSNGILPEALFVAYKKIGNDAYLKVARESLDFLIQNSFENGMCTPVGQNGWLRRGGIKGMYDQQPEEVSTLVSTLVEAYAITREEKYLKFSNQAFNWFLGSNKLGQMVYDESTGGSYDGIGETHVNLNQGAESTIMYILARLVMEDNMKKLI